MDPIARSTLALVLPALAWVRRRRRGHHLRQLPRAAVRNPSAAQGQFGNLIFGFAVTEALGIFSLLIALLLLFRCKRVRPNGRIPWLKVMWLKVMARPKPRTAPPGAEGGGHSFRRSRRTPLLRNWCRWRSPLSRCI